MAVGSCQLADAVARQLTVDSYQLTVEISGFTGANWIEKTLKQGHRVKIAGSGFGGRGKAKPQSRERLCRD